MIHHYGILINLTGEHSMDFFPLHQTNVTMMIVSNGENMISK